MLLKQKRDIAISVAEEDLPIALQIAGALKEKRISYYLYKEHRAKNWGQHILKTSLDSFGANAKYVLMITSKTYAEKYWSNIERQISHIFQTDTEPYILQLRLDDTEIDGLSKNIVFEYWKNNPEEIAGIIEEKLKLKDQSSRDIISPLALSQGTTKHMNWVFAIGIAVLMFSPYFINPNPTAENKLPLKPNNTSSVEYTVDKSAADKDSVKSDNPGNLEVYSQRCQATTKKGSQCKRMATSGKFCRQHKS